MCIYQAQYFMHGKLQALIHKLFETKSSFREVYNDNRAPFSSTSLAVCLIWIR